MTSGKAAASLAAGLLIAVSGVLASPVLTRAAGFAAATTYPVGAGPRLMAVGDFGSDGELDLAVANGSSLTISILLGAGGGTFAAAVDYVSGDTGVFEPYAGSLTAADFNSDGALDLAVGTGWLLLGNGDGTFTRGPDHSVVGGPVTSGDFNGDGLADLAVTVFRIVCCYSRYNAVSVLLGHSDGTFGPAIETPVCCSAGDGSITGADFDLDGNLDLVLSQWNRGEFLFVLLGNGDGTFATTTFHPSGGSYGVTSGDLNEDGRPDLLLGAGYVNELWVMLGNGNGTFAEPSAYPAGAYARALATGDFDGDGHADVAVEDGFFSDDDNVLIYYGVGDGTLAVGGRYAVGHLPASIASADFNDDSRDDVAVTNLGAGTVSILLAAPFDAAIEIASLKTRVLELGLSRGATRSLTLKLDSALAALNAGDSTRACDFLASFISDLARRSGKSLTAIQARDLTASARWIGGHLGC